MTANLLSAVLAASSEGIALLDAEGRFTEVNLAFVRLFGRERDEIVDKTLRDLLVAFTGNDVATELEGEDVAPGPIARLLYAVRRRESLADTEIELWVSGQPCLLKVSVTPVTEAGEAVVLLMARDVTGGREVTQMKAKFFSMMAHELRAPLNTINGYLDLTLSGVGGELNEQQHEFVQRARAGSESLYAMLENLLLIARADGGQLRLHKQVVSLPQVVEQAVEELELLAGDRGITVEVEFPSAFPYLYGDAVRLQQVLRNLLSNALHFTASGERVRISGWSEMVEQGGSEEEERPNRVAFLRIEDNGIGIAEEYHERIFERFFQVPQTQSGGQGLGLSIVKLIVELHGGLVGVESGPGRGSTFTCRFPCVVS